MTVMDTARPGDPSDALTDFAGGAEQLAARDDGRTINAPSAW